MPDVLTSFRVSEDSLQNLRQIAAANDTSVAEEIRRSVDAYVEQVLASPDFNERLRAQLAKNNEQIERLLSMAARA